MIEAAVMTVATVAKEIGTVAKEVSTIANEVATKVPKTLERTFNDISDIASKTTEKLERNFDDISDVILEDKKDNELLRGPQETLDTSLDKEKLQLETGWSNEIIDAIDSEEEAQIYKDADLKEVNINDKSCLVRNDLDMNQKDEFGRTNQERMENGLAPLSKDGETIELHHIGQKSDSPLAELTSSEHRANGNDTILHDKTKTSEIDRNSFRTEKQEHWKARAENTN